MRRLVFDGTVVTVGTEGDTRPVFIQSRRMRRPKLVGYVVRCPYCQCRRPHRWRAIPVDEIDRYRTVVRELREYPGLQSTNLAIEHVSGPRHHSIGSGVFDLRRAFA